MGDKVSGFFCDNQSLVQFDFQILESLAIQELMQLLLLRDPNFLPVYAQHLAQLFPQIQQRDIGVRPQLRLLEIVHHKRRLIDNLQHQRFPFPHRRQ